MSFNELSAQNRSLALAMENYAQLMMLLIITCLSAYAANICWQLLQQKKIARQAQAVLKRQRSESRHDHQESISVLIRCLSQGQVTVTEASIRISGLAKMLDLNEDERKQYQAFDDLAYATSHIPILADWKRLSSKERYKFTLERETIESEFEERIQHAVKAVDRMLNQR